MLRFVSCPHIDNSHIMKTKRMHVVTNIPQPTCMAIFNDLINSQKSFIIFTPGIFLSSPNFKGCRMGRSDKVSVAFLF